MLLLRPGKPPSPTTVWHLTGHHDHYQHDTRHDTPLSNSIVQNDSARRPGKSPCLTAERHLTWYPTQQLYDTWYNIRLTDSISLHMPSWLGTERHQTWHPTHSTLTPYRTPHPIPEQWDLIWCHTYSQYTDTTHDHLSSHIILTPDEILPSDCT